MKQHQSELDRYQSKFKVGERVFDREDDDRDSMIVLDANVGRADDVTVEIDGVEETVAELNPDYPPQDPVVRVVFVSWLDAHVPGWKEWDDTQMFGRTLREYADEWGVPLETYDYPESRLEHVRDFSGWGGDDGGSPVAAPTTDAATVDGPTPDPTTGDGPSASPTLTANRRVPSMSAEGMLVARAQQ